MVCDICRNMLGLQHGRYAKGTLDIRYEHHRNAQTFQDAVKQNCYICKSLYISLLDHLKGVISQPRGDPVESNSHTTAGENFLSNFAQHPLSSEASLFLEELNRTYRLEIKLKFDQVTIQHAFRLESGQGSNDNPNQRSVHVQYPTRGAVRRTLPRSSLLREFELVHQWLKMCKCYSTASESFYPTRLINLANVKASISEVGTHHPQVTINLVERDSWSTASLEKTISSNRRYVTLSHCWGGEVNPRLLSGNLEDFKRGMPISDLPKTFQDAIYFAASLDQVDYIWIDSLCIIQGDAPDWTKESATMHLVYSNSFLNISATASSSSHGGLFKDSDFELLQPDDVELDIEGLPQAYDREGVPICPHDRPQFFKKRCTVVDASFWDNQVDKGPVNTRGWVLQERLMSPRVVHFCHDQVGWDCACCDAPEAVTNTAKQEFHLPDGQSRYHGLLEGIRKRFLDAKPAANSNARIASSPFDLWAAVVELYTKTLLTCPGDKLIALSGLAAIMSNETQCAYIAGLWRMNLASQLLWYIEPAFDHLDRSFSNPATFDSKYRAPSWSWAAVDVTNHGITYGKAARQKLFVTIEDTHVDTPPNLEYGAVSDAHITLRGKLRRARLISIPINRFAWYFVDCGDLDVEQHRNVYLDCPLRDIDCIDAPGMYVYILPIAEEIEASGTTQNLYIMCLILRTEQESGMFKRVGMTKLSPFMDKDALAKVEIEGQASQYKVLTSLTNDAILPHADYDAKTEEYRIHLV